MLLAGASTAATIVATRSGMTDAATDRAARSVPCKVSNSRSDERFFVVEHALPGRSGRRRMVLANVALRPFSRGTLTQDRVWLGGFSSALQLQVYDAIARRCLHPRPPAAERVPQVKVESDRCSHWMPFDGRSRIHDLLVPGFDGSSTWNHGEQHAIDVRWRLAPRSPNSDQGRRAGFRLAWNVVG